MKHLFIFLGIFGTLITGITYSANLGSKEMIEKVYDDSERKVSLRNKDGELVFEAKLETAYSVMVPAGEDIKVAEIKLVDWDAKHDKMFDNIQAYSNKDGQTLSKQFTYKYVTEYTESASVDENDKITLHNEPNWNTAVLFTSVDELPSKNILIGIFTNTTLGESVEWIPIIRGVSVAEWADYDVTEINSLEHDTSNGSFNSLVKIDSTHFILAYLGVSLDNYITTFSIDGSYNITEIDTLIHDTNALSNNDFNSLVQIDSTHFILAYRGESGDGYIKTFSIDGSYVITEINSLEHDTSNNSFNSLVQIDSTHFMLAYDGGADGGEIKTFSIDGSYVITEIDALSHDATNGEYNSLVKIDSTHFMLAYGGADTGAGTTYDGFVTTFSIDGSYVITEINSLEHDTIQGEENSLVQIDSTHFMLAYSGSGDDGFVTTFSIDGSYNITEVNSIEHDTSKGTDNSLVKIDSTHFMLAYDGGVGSDGTISTFSIDGSYNITEVSSTIHDSVDGLYNSLVQIDSTHYILAYAGSGIDGFIKTFLLEVAAGITAIPNFYHRNIFHR